METILDWAEKAGIENLKEHSNNADLLQRQASTLVTLLLSGAGTALYFGMQHDEAKIVILSISFWLFSVASFVTTKCLMFGDFPTVWNEPMNLFQREYELSKLREFELENLQQRINVAKEINRKKSLRINGAILGACFTPVIGFIAWLV